MDDLRQPEAVTGIALIQNLTSAIWIRYTYMMVNCKFGRAGQFGYLATGRVNIRIHRDITGPP